MAGARSIVTKIGNIDLRSITNGESFSSLINWDGYAECSKQWETEEKFEVHFKYFDEIYFNQFVSMLRNPFKLMLEKLLTESPLWNDDSENNFIYFLYISHEEF